MNIGLFHNLPPGGGAIRVLAEYVRHSTGHDFTVYTRQAASDGLVALDPSLRVRRLPFPETPTRAARLRLLRELPRRGAAAALEIDAGDHEVIFCHSSVLTHAPEVLPYLQTPTLFYAPETLRPFYEPLPSFGRQPSVKGTLVQWGLDPYEHRRKVLDRRFIRAAERIVTHSYFTRGELRRIYGVNGEVVPLGVDSATFAPRPSASRDFVLSVGALHPLKGHQFVIEAIATLPAPRPALVIVADRGHFEEPLRGLARDRGVDLKVRRELPLSALVDLYASAGAVACGQIHEPFGLVTLEAMASGTPVVAVREGGFLETVEDCVTGLLVKREPGVFGAALWRVLTDQRLAAALAKAGRRAAVEDFPWERTAAGYDALLEELALASRQRQ